MSTDYKLLRDAYYGTGGFDNADYLVKHGRETESQYEERKKVAYYPNYFAPIVNALVNPIFRKEPLRDWKNQIIANFLEDVDCAGTPMQKYVKAAALRAKITGVTFAVVDNFTELPERLDIALNMRRFPYVISVDPERVVEYNLDRAGRCTRFVFRDVPNEKNERATITWTKNTWQILGEDGSVKKQGEHNLGRVPVAVLFSKSPLFPTLLPPPEFMAIARTAKYLYNETSWLAQIFKNQTFSILTIPDKTGKEFSIGTNNALCYDGELSGHSPAFISPDAGPAETLISHLKMIVEEMYRQAGLSYVTGTKKESSGYSKQWDFENTNRELVDFANNCQQFEQDIVNLFCAWQKVKSDYQVDYPDDFGIVDVGSEIEKAQSLKDLGFGSSFDIEVLKRVLAAVFPDLPDDMFDKIVKEAETAAKEATYNEPEDIPPNEEVEDGNA